MNTADLKKLLVKRIQSTTDKDFLNALRILTEDRIAPLQNEVRKKLENSLADLDSKKLVDEDDVFEELEKWLEKK